MESEDTIIYNYPAVVDLETEQVYVFTCLENAGCLSVSNSGLVSLATPKVEYFRYAHIASIADPTKSQTLTEWTKQQTGDKIDLAKYMTYTDDQGQSMVADGSAILRADGRGYFTNQYNGFGGNQRYETYFVSFDAGTANEVVVDNGFVVYPNPTDGVLFVSEDMVNVRLMDVTGRVVYEVSEVVDGIDLSTLAAGTYIFAAEMDGKIVTTKVVKK